MSRRIKEITLKLPSVSSPDKTPYGDIFADDEGLERMRRDFSDRYEIGKMTRSLYKSGRMPKAKFKDWMAHIGDIDDDEPLKKYL